MVKPVLVWGDRSSDGVAGRSSLKKIMHSSVNFFVVRLGQFLPAPLHFSSCTPQSCTKTKLSIYKLYIFFCILDYEIR